MAGSTPLIARKPGVSHRSTEPVWVKITLTLIALVFIALFLILPLIEVFYQALSSGWGSYVTALKDPDNLTSVKITLLTAAIAVPLNVLFGVAAAWAISKFNFRGKNILISIIDLPFAVSPVIAGMMFVLLFGRGGVLYPWLDAHNIKIIFELPGVILATTFVTFPFVARELIPIMEAQGMDEEQAAVVLGASGWQIFRRVTLPNIRYGLLFGVILCNARAMGEFGAVSVVTAHIAGMTNTMPLQVDLLYNDFDSVGAFTLASLLTVLALVTLVAKSIVEWLAGRQTDDPSIHETPLDLATLSKPISSSSGTSAQYLSIVSPAAPSA